MIKHVFFIQGAGQGAYEADKKLAASLQQALGAEYEVRFPAMPDECEAPYEQLKQHLLRELAPMQGRIALVGHSVGGSILAKFLGEVQFDKPVAAICLMATPFWGGDGWRYDGYEELEVPQDVATRFPKDAHVFLYHCRDDETVPFDHLAKFAKLLPQAAVRELDKGGHQLDNAMAIVAQDLKS